MLWVDTCSFIFTLFFVRSTSRYSSLWISDPILARSILTLSGIQKLRGMRHQEELIALLSMNHSSISKQWWTPLSPVSIVEETTQQQIKWLLINSRHLFHTTRTRYDELLLLCIYVQHRSGCIFSGRWDYGLVTQTIKATTHILFSHHLPALNKNYARNDRDLLCLQMCSTDSAR